MFWRNYAKDIAKLFVISVEWALSSLCDIPYENAAAKAAHKHREPRLFNLWGWFFLNPQFTQRRVATFAQKLDCILLRDRANARNFKLRGAELDHVFANPSVHLIVAKLKANVTRSKNLTSVFIVKDRPLVRKGILIFLLDVEVNPGHRPL